MPRGPLEKRIISIQFAQGLDQKTEPKLTTKLTTADNAVLRKTGTIEKRLGFVALGNWSLSANPVKAFPFRDSVFVINDWSGNKDTATGSSDNTFGQSQSALNDSAAIVNGAWVSMDYALDAGVAARAVIANASNVVQAGVAIINKSATQTGVAACFGLGQSATLGSAYAPTDLDTKSEILLNPGLVLGASNLSGKIRAVSTSAASITAIFVKIASTAFIKFLKGTSSSITLSSVASTHTAENTTNPQLDAVAIGSKVFYAAKQSSSTGIILGSYDVGTEAISETVIPASVTPDVLSFVTPDPSTDRVRLLWVNNSSHSAFMASYSLTLSQILAATQFAVTSSSFPHAGVIQLEGCENSGATSWDLFYTLGPASATFPVVTIFQANVTNTSASTMYIPDVNSSYEGYGGCTLASKPFQAHGASHVIMNWSATGSQCFCVVRTDLSTRPMMRALARFHYGIAAPNFSSSYEWLPLVPSTDADTYWHAARRAMFFASQGSQITVNYGVDLVSINLSQTQPVPYVQISDLTLLGGGLLREYDSAGLVECGFYTPPSICGVSISTAGGSLTTGGYSVVLVKEWTDHVGRTHRSQPSIPVTFTSSSTQSSVTISFVDGPGGKNHYSSRFGQTRFVAYRTQANLQIYYRDSTMDPSTYAGGFRVPSSAISLTQADTTISGDDAIYTQGGALPHFTPDGVVALAVHKNRVFCNDSYDQSIIRFSNEMRSGEGPAFAQANTISAPGNDPVTALASLDSTLVGFRSRMIFAIAGDGPDDTGSNGAFSDGQMLFADIGAINQRNICRMSAGVVFKSPDKGFYLLTRDLQLQYIGADVESYNSKTVVSSEAVALPELDGSAEECRFLCSDGTLLIYNYYNGQWSTATLSGCVDAVQSGGSYIVVNTSTTAANARVFAQSLSTYIDAFSNTSVTYQMTAETGWIKTNDTTGFQRIWDVIVFGTATGPGQLSVDVGYDYETTYNETYTATMSSLTAANYTGGAQAEPQMHFKPIRQKCEAIRFRIKDIPDPGNTTGVFKLTDISLECGVKAGRFKLPASKDGV